MEAVEGKGMATDAARWATLRACSGKSARLRVRSHPSTACPARCRQEDCTEHLLRCPAYATARHAVLGEVSPPLTVLQSAPHKVVRYLQRIGRASASSVHAATSADDSVDRVERPDQAI